MAANIWSIGNRLLSDSYDIWDHFREKGPNACFSRFHFLKYSRSLKCPLHIASYALRIGVSIMEFVRL